MDGFEAELKKRLMSSDLHVLITPTSETPSFSGGFVPRNALDQTGASELIKSDPRVLSFLADCFYRSDSKKWKKSDGRRG